MLGRAPPLRRHVGVKTEGCNTYENQEHTPQKLGCKLHSVLQVLQRYRRAYSERHPVKIEKKSPPPGGARLGGAPPVPRETALVAIPIRYRREIDAACGQPGMCRAACRVLAGMRFASSLSVYTLCRRAHARSGILWRTRGLTHRGPYPLSSGAARHSCRSRAVWWQDADRCTPEMNKPAPRRAERF